MTTPVKIALAVVVVIVLAVAGWLLLRSPGVEESGPDAIAAEPTVAPSPTPTLAERLSARLAGVTLATSDAAVRQVVGELSSRPELAAWLATDDLIRRFVASVHNIADGVSPKAHLEFLRPAEPFQVVREADRVTVDPASWRRYDRVASVVSSLDAVGTVALYRELEPLVDEAHREIAPPGQLFQERLVAAIDHLLAAPLPEAPVEVVEKVVTFSYADQRYESLSTAQRQLLRMGPENATAVRSKLAELRAALAATAPPA